MASPFWVKFFRDPMSKKQQTIHGDMGRGDAKARLAHGTKFYRHE